MGRICFDRFQLSICLPNDGVQSRSTVHGLLCSFRDVCGKSCLRMNSDRWYAVTARMQDGCEKDLKLSIPRLSMMFTAPTFGHESNQ